MHLWSFSWFSQLVVFNPAEAHGLNFIGKVVNVNLEKTTGAKIHYSRSFSDYMCAVSELLT